MTETVERITITEAASICGCTEQTIRNWTARRGFPAPDGNKRYDHSAVLEWAGRHAIRTARLIRS
jgi:DNA-binding transcriptional MerR regulator